MELTVGYCQEILRRGKRILVVNAYLPIKMEKKK
jgi:hypothetical protein